MPITYTSTTFASWQPKGEHVGLQAVRGQYASGATSVSAGDVIFLAKVPHGALPVELTVDHSTGSTSFAISYGVATGGPAGSASYSCYIASGAQATKLRLSVLGLPAQISVSDNDPNRYGILAAKVESGTSTASLFINFAFTYLADFTT